MEIMLSTYQVPNHRDGFPTALRAMRTDRTCLEFGGHHLRLHPEGKKNLGSSLA